MISKNWVGVAVSFVFGVVMSRNFTVRVGEFQFSTDDDDHSLARLLNQYKSRVDHLKTAHSADLLREYTVDGATEATKARIVKRAAELYASPIGNTQMFGQDVVLFNCGADPTIILRGDFDDVQDKWKRILVMANVKDRIDTWRLKTENSIIPFINHSTRVEVAAHYSTVGK